MEKRERNVQTAAPMLFPIEPEQFWQILRVLVREEVSQLDRQPVRSPAYDTPGLTYKPLFKIGEVCQLFQVTKPTIYDWIKHGKLKPYKIRSRVYFLWNDIQQLLQPGQQPKQ
ncbi:helix-turn-helix domain-containing protein [Chitinophaga filiformis]|uniref:Helix-turn-helix domain-containing protein n=1 Tax=Chitinophaga filiformis TaxID=104663 RepID=A0ABY4IBC9_CHIFI|nr:helix-turn-helix domain-containing protein [Chitinophaga filiformis]UPK72855.1 helix-turn-helix domain-containing protein [Chitinophaga filiformis]